MQQNNKAKTVLIVLLSLFSSIAVTVAVFVAGMLLRDVLNSDVMAFIAVVSMIGVVACCIVNPILVGRKRKKYGKLKVAESYKMLLDKKSDLGSDLSKATERLENAAKTCRTYLIFASALMLLLIFSLGTQASVTSTLVVYVTLMLASIFSRLFGAALDTPKPEKKEILPERDYPEIYAIAKRARDEAELDGTVGITTDNSFNAAISKIGNQYYLLLGCSLVNSLSREELYNILLHEFAHLSEKYTPKSPHGFLSRFMTYESSAFPFGDIYFSYPMINYAEEYFLYTLLANEYIEVMADAITVKKGNPRAFASAIAKCNLHSQYERLLYKYQGGALFETEEPQADIAEQYLSGFHRALEENQDKWMEMFEREIQARNASHPIYRERRNAVGVAADEVEISFDIAGDGLDRERRLLTEYTNAEILKILSPNYEELRRQNYLTPLSIIEEWEKDKESFPKTEIGVVIQAMIDIMRHEDAEALCDHIIETEENIYLTAFARSFKGYMLVNREDPRGVELLYQAIELNSNLFEMSIDPIGEFACRNGLQDVLDEYREKAIALAQKSADEDDQANTLSKKDNLVHDDMSESALAAHVDFIVGTSDKIKSIYLVKKVISESFCSHVFLIEFEARATAETINEAMGKIFRYLDTLDNEQYSLFLYAPIHKPIVKRVEGSKIYSKSK